MLASRSSRPLTCPCPHCSVVLHSFPTSRSTDLHMMSFISLPVPLTCSHFSFQGGHPWKAQRFSPTLQTDSLGEQLVWLGYRVGFVRRQEEWMWGACTHALTLRYPVFILIMKMHAVDGNKYLTDFPFGSDGGAQNANPNVQGSGLTGSVGGLL